MVDIKKFMAEKGVLSRINVADGNVFVSDGTIIMAIGTRNADFRNTRICNKNKLALSMSKIHLNRKVELDLSNRDDIVNSTDEQIIVVGESMIRKSIIRKLLVELGMDLKIFTDGKKNSLLIFASKKADAVGYVASCIEVNQKNV